MKSILKLSCLTFIITILLGISNVWASPNDVINNDKSETGYLFVLSSQSGTVEGDTVTLHNVPTVVYFTDRPNRKTGQMNVSNFLAGWNAQSDDFTDNPPNAVLSILNEEGNQNITVVLKNPRIKGQDISFDIETLQGTLPKKFNSSSLFIDPVNQNGMWTGT